MKSMAYKVVVSPRVQKEVENAIDYYALYSTNAPAAFIARLNEAYSALAVNPFFGLRYKNIRSLKLNTFPYSLFYTVNEQQNIVRVLSCFHNKRDPDHRPGY